MSACNFAVTIELKDRGGVLSKLQNMEQRAEIRMWERIYRASHSDKILAVKTGGGRENAKRSRI